MVTIEHVETSNKQEVNRFVQFPFGLYEGNEQWVPPITADIKTMLNKNKHPFYEHSEAKFFVAMQGNEMVGRIACLENKKYNEYHDKKQATFYLFETVKDFSVAESLFSRAFDWAKKRGLDTIVGPKGLSSFDGYGLLIEGFDKRQMMTMMNFNPPEYPQYLEKLGFKKAVDWVSSYVHIPEFEMPEKVLRVAQRVEEREISKSI